MDAFVENNKRISDDCHLLTLSLTTSHFHKTALPGQFIMVKCGNFYDPLLRRPFAIHRVVGKRTIEILLRIKGKGTKILANTQKGDCLDIIGPLGKGFEIKPNSVPIIIGTGIGIAPLLFLKDALLKKIKSGIPISPPRILIAGRRDTDIFRERAFSEGDCQTETFIYKSHEDIEIKITNYIDSIIARQIHVANNRHLPCSSPPPVTPILYVCTSAKLCKTIAKIANEKQVEAQISMESHMACGFGVCLGCAIKLKHEKSFKMKRVCTEGPVFLAKDLIWE